ncbi:MAG: flagellar motor protein MotB [Oscillospiraceae bacterium]
MAKKKVEESGGSWMDTYGDLVTLLLTFFVLLYSMSSIAEDKWAKLVKAFNSKGNTVVEQIVFTYDATDGEDALNNTGEGMGEDDSAVNQDEVTIDFNELYSYLRDYIAASGMEENIVIEQSEEVNAGEQQEPGSQNIYIQFKNNVLFEPDKSALRPESTDMMNFIGDCLKSLESQIALVIIKGHTATGSVDSYVDSRILSSERASTISNYFEDNFGLPSTMLIPMGLAGDYPIATNDTDEGRAMNRRVEMVIIGKDSSFAQSGELLRILGASFTVDSGDVNDVVVADEVN